MTSDMKPLSELYLTDRKNRAKESIISEQNPKQVSQ